jgi:UPF0755 protein
MSKRVVSRIFYTIVGIGVILFIINAFKIYNKIYSENIVLKDKESASLYIPTGADFDEVVDSLIVNNYLADTASFFWVAKKMQYKNIHPGHYIIKDGMNNKTLISKLRAGIQAPVKVVFHNIETVQELAGVIGKQIEADSLDLISLLENKNYVDKLGFELHTIKSMFIPNTYEFYWNTLAKDFINRMQKEYNKFWNEDRIEKARVLNFTKTDVSTLASIVHKETLKKEEEPKIAGVYINRLRKRMRLQADPTVKYLLPDTVERVLKRHLSIKSPYNTYQHYGLPPGPIAIPPISAIDAVLNYVDHNYLYFCAKEDFSGYHVFAKTLQQHLINARKYQNELNKRKIWR